MSSSLLALRTQSEATTAEQKRLVERKKSILLFIYDYLSENGFLETAKKLTTESAGLLSKYCVADNVDLLLILNEYEAYYEMKFGKKPKLIRKLKEGEDQPYVPRIPDASQSSSSASSKKQKKSDITSEKLPILPNGNNSQSSLNSSAPEDDSNNNNNNSNSTLGIQGTSVNTTNKNKKSDGDSNESYEERLLKPPPQFGGDMEMKQLAASISREIYQESPNVRFENIISLDEAKRLLCEAIQLPIRFPMIFTGILRPWRGILLHGPPGTGKTMLAKAVATECKTTFFNISASTLVSKWRGDSEKLVRVLFELARYHAPSTIFLDEIDSILTSRGGEGGGGSEHEASRRMKTELLIQMDGVKGAINGRGPTEQVFVMAASNLPWDLDVAVLRRLEKRVLVSLPVAAAREAMVRRHIEDRAAVDVDYAAIAAGTEGYSGADIELICREAAMMPVRRLIQKVLAAETAAESQAQTRRGPGTGKAPGAKVGSGMGVGVYGTVDADALIKSDPVSNEDLLLALTTTKPSSDGKMAQYEKWQGDFGSV